MAAVVQANNRRALAVREGKVRSFQLTEMAAFGSDADDTSIPAARLHPPKLRRSGTPADLSYKSQERPSFASPATSLPQIGDGKFRSCALNLCASHWAPFIREPSNLARTMNERGTAKASASGGNTKWEDDLSSTAHLVTKPGPRPTRNVTPLSRGLGPG